MEKESKVKKPRKVRKKSKRSRSVQKSKYSWNHVVKEVDNYIWIGIGVGVGVLAYFMESQLMATLAGVCIMKARANGNKPVSK